MLSIGTAASVDYYLGRSQGSSEKLGVAPAAGSGQGVSYYQKELETDPLARRGRWGGKFADELGLRSGSTVDARQFRNLSYGHDPATGKPLKEGMPSFAEQEAADKELARLERAHAKARSAYLKARSAAQKAGRSPEDDAETKAALFSMERIAADRRSFSTTNGVRTKASDLAFTVPKTLSVHLVGLLAEAQEEKDPARRAELESRAAAIEEIIHRAVDSTMRHIESEWPLARPRNGAGTRLHQPMEGLAWAQFMHFDARPVDGAPPDPNAHVHATLMGVGMMFDGGVQAVWTKYIGENVHVLGARFRSEVAQGLRELGYDIVPEEQDKVLSFRLAGMEKSEADMFSARAREIESNRGMGMGASAAKLAGRESKLDEDEFDGRDFLRVTRERMAAMGLTADGVKGSAAERRAKVRERVEREMTRAWSEAWRVRLAAEAAGEPVGDPPKGPRPPSFDPSETNARSWSERVDRMTDKELERDMAGLSSMVPDILEHCLEMETYFTTRDIERRVAELAQFVSLPEGMTLDEYRRRQVAEVLSSPELMEVQGPDGPNGYDMSGLPIFTTRGQREAETRLYGSIFPKLMDARDRLSMSSEDAARAVEAWERRNKARLADNQRATARDILENSSGFQIVQGMAGSGKTFMAKCSFDVLKDAGAKLIAMAPSTSAALLLKNEIGAADAYTPESLAAALERNDMARQRGESVAPLIDRNTIVFLDEASMLDFRETLALAEAVSEAGGKIILSGDARQLLSVGAGNVYKRLMAIASGKMEEARERGDESAPKLVSYLNRDFGDHDTIQRQSRSIGRQIVALAETGETARALDALDRRGMVVRHDDPEAMLESVARERAAGAPKIDCEAEVERVRRALESDKAERDRALRRFYGKMDELSKFHSSNLVVAETRRQVATVNASCRRMLKEAGILGRTDHPLVLSDGRRIGVALGDRLAFTEKATGRHVEFRGGATRGVATKGTTGTVIGVDTAKNGRARVKLLLDEPGKNGRPWIYIDGTGDFAGLDHAYAMTVHKSQGQTADNVQYIGTPKSNANLFLVGISRFKKSFKLHSMIGDLEAYKNAVGREQRRVDATELSAASFNVLDPKDIEEYREAAAESLERARSVREAIERGAEDPEARRRMDAARAARMARDGLASRILESAAIYADRFVGRDAPLPAGPADEGLNAALRELGASSGARFDDALAMGVAVRDGVPGRRKGAVEDVLTTIKKSSEKAQEMIYDLIGYARKGLGERRTNEIASGKAGGLGDSAIGSIGGGSEGNAREGARADVGGYRGPSGQDGVLLSMREGTLASVGSTSDLLLRKDRKDDVGSSIVGQQHINDDVRRDNHPGDQKAGGASNRGAGRRDSDAAADWEWLGLRGDRVIARNLRSGQFESWSRSALVEAGRGDLVEMAAMRLGRIEDPEPTERKRAPLAEGRLIETGKSHFRDDPTRSELPHAVFEREDGTRSKVWGAGLVRALESERIRAGEWVRVDNAEREIVSLPCAFGTEGSTGAERAVLEHVDAHGSVGVRTLAGEFLTIPGDRAEGFAGAAPGDEVTVSFVEKERAIWRAERVASPNPISHEARSRAWEGALARMESRPRILEAFGLDADRARSLWRAGARDVMPWDMEEAGAKVYEALGWREDEGRRFLGTVLARDEKMVYLACGTGGRDGSMEDATDRIVAVPASVVGDAADGAWVSLKASSRGIRLSAGGATEICAAAEAGDVERVRDLLARGADPESADHKGRTAAYLAAKAGEDEALRILLDAGARPDVPDAQGRTPLVSAALGGHAKAAEALIEAGADPSASSDGWTPESAATAGRSKECAEVVRAAKARGRSR